MRIIKNEIDPKRKNGFVVLVPIDEEDIWFAYNIIVVGDILRLKTMRKVLHQKGDFAVKTTQRKLITITVKVLAVRFEADEKGTSLMLKTRNLSENEFVTKGQIQTIEVQLLQKLQVIKDFWDPHSLAFLEESADASKNVDSLVVLLDDGYAAFYTLKRNFLKLHGKLTKSLPKKKTAIMDIYKRKTDEFDAQVWKYLFECFANWDAIKAVVLAGPGNARSRIFDKLRDIDHHEKNEALRKLVKQNLGKVVSIPTSSTFKSAISEVLRDKTGAKLLEDTKAVREVRKLEEFYNIFMKDSNMAVFGEREVRFARDQGAIRSLLITDGLLRAKNFSTRKKMMALVDDIQAAGAEVFMFNENHDSGSKLRDITGIAAILRFPIDVESVRETTPEDEQEDTRLSQEAPEDEEQELNRSFIMGGDELLGEDA